MSDQNGITQTPFDKAWPTPDVGGTGANGIGGGLDAGAGGSGIVNSPFDKAWPAPGIERTSGGDIPNPPDFVQTDGGAPGTNAPWDVTSSRNTVDKK
jgi:hypothetical protein